MDSLTGYFVTTDRINAEESLASLGAQGLRHPIAVVRNVRPLHAAYRHTLACHTEYCALLDDDTVLKPDALAALFSLFVAARKERPEAYLLTAAVFSEALQMSAGGGFKMLYVPHLRRVGWPDAPHVAVMQLRAAERIGLISLKTEFEAGVEKRGTNLDLYKKYLWIQIRVTAGQRRPVNLTRLLDFARADMPWMWFAILGVLEGVTATEVKTSKDEDYMGPVARTLDFAKTTADDVRRLLASRGFAPAAA